MATSIQERALALLGSGIDQESTASALGVTPSYISQLLADETFAAEVSRLKVEALSKHTRRDAEYDEVEDALLGKLKKVIPLMLRPETILGAIKVINGAKRRGHDSIEGAVAQQNIVQLTLPVQVIQKITTNINNQVIKTGEQNLITMQSSDLLKTAESNMKQLEQVKTEEAVQDETMFEELPVEMQEVLNSL